jgi:undecaprenyl diphosphate synthase
MGVEIMRFKPWKQNVVESEDSVAMDRLPNHIAIIMDGNGRWAQKRALPRSMGHRAGVEALRQIVKTCSKLKIQVLTVYAFSTENWRRPKDEVGVLMTLLTEYLRKELLELQQNNVIIRTMGKINDLPLEAQHELAHAIESTRENTGLILNLALNYGGRAEIIDTVKSMSKEVLSGKIRIEEIDEQHFGESLYTRGLPDPDMLIRTSGEIRLSNFLLWQLAYTEIVVVEELWPDFGQKALIEAIKAYQKRDRRFGGIHTN